MNERLLQFIWQNKLFNFSNLITVHGEKIEIQKIGFLNDYDGPDFLDARLKIGEIDWAGSVEIHCKDIDWLSHGHQHDERYGSVILHVVWEISNTKTIPEGVPCLILKDYINPKLLHQYELLIDSGDKVSCHSFLGKVDDYHKSLAIEHALYNRMKRRSVEFQSVCRDFNDDWQQTFFYLICRAMGKKANKEAMILLAEGLPVKYLLKHVDQEESLQALLFGVAGFLDKPVGEFHLKLAKEFSFLKKKYNLPVLSALGWNNSRVRGLSRPHLSLAFLSSMIPFLYDLKELDKRTEILDRLELPDYWKSHHDFGKNSKVLNSVSKTLIEHIKINVIVPYLSMLSYYYDDSSYLEKAEGILEKCKKEENSIVKRMSDYNFKMENASRTQGGIELFNEYCSKKRCLDCIIGTRILGRS